MRALLDVNVWVALFDDAHQFSEQANAFIETPRLKIATCPLVENGVIRVMSLPGYGKRGGLQIRQVRERLKEACTALDHAFWPDDVSLRDDAHVDFAECKATTRSLISTCSRWRCTTAAASSRLTRPSPCPACRAPRPGI